MHGSTHHTAHPDTEAALLARIERTQAHMAKPTAAQRNARAMSELMRLGGNRRPPTEAERAWIKATASNLREASTAQAQWKSLDPHLRRLLVHYAGLRDNSPGESLSSIADREWSDFIRTEQKAISDVMRRLLRHMAQQTALTQKVRVRT